MKTTSHLLLFLFLNRFTPFLSAAGEAESFRAAREALAERDYAAAAQRLQAFRKEFPASPLAEEGEILLGRALQLSGKSAEAIEALRSFIEGKPESRFAVKARLLMAEIYIQEKRFAEASEIYRARLEFLRGDAYRDRIAGYYLEIADPAFDGRKAQDPSTLIQREILVRDFPAALEHYRKALAVMGGGKLRAARGDEIEMRIGRALLALEKGPEAAAHLAALTARPAWKPAPPLRLETLFTLGEARRKAGDSSGAIQAFSLVEKEADHPRAPEALMAIGEVRLERAAAIPGEKEKKGEFEAGLAALDAFLTRFPQHRLAPEAAFLAAAARAEAGDRQGAIARLRELIKKYGRDERAPAAQLRIAEILRRENSFDAAIEEWKRFLGAYPSDARWSEAQAAIEKALYEKGLHLLTAEKKPAEARRAWEQFLLERPASDLGPEVYTRFYEMSLEAKDYPAAAEALRLIVTKYPSSPLAPSSQLTLARLLEERAGDLEGAIRELEDLQKRFPRSQDAARAAEHLRLMRGKHLTLSSPRVYHTGEPWTLRIATRNLPRLRLRAHRVNLEEYFRKHLSLDEIEALAVGIVEPTKAWDLEVAAEEKGGYRPYQLFEADRKLPLPEDESGAYLITAEEEELRAATLALRSDLAMVTKPSPRQTFIWAFNERTGAPWPGARVLLADAAGVFHEGKTDDDGSFALEHRERRPDVRAFLIAPGLGPHAVHLAFDAADIPGEISYGYTTKVHVTTDRPLYRPEQTVHFRAMLRKVVDGRAASSEGEKAEVSVVNPLGVILYQETLQANDFGAVAGDVELTDEPPLGDYLVKVTYQGQTSEGKFKVEEYRKPEFEVQLAAERPAYLRGEEIKGKIQARYLFGGPVPRARVSWRIFEGPYAFDLGRFEEQRWFFAAAAKKDADRERSVRRFKSVAEGQGETDSEGNLPLAFQPAPDGADHTYRIQIEATDLSRVTVTGVEDVLATGEEFYVVARAARKVYRPGDKVQASIRTVDPAGRPVDAKGEVILARRVRGEAGQVFDRELEKMRLDTKGGKGEATLAVKEPGEYRILFRSSDRGGNRCEGGAIVQVAGDSPDLAREARLLFEKGVYHQGEEAKLFLNSPIVGRHALLTFEGDRVISHRVIPISKKSDEVAVAMEGRFSPNVRAAVTIPGGNVLHQAQDEAIVLEYLDVEVSSDKPEYLPGEEAKLTVRVRDQSGKPRDAELSIAVIDAAILQLQGDLALPVKPFFYDQQRAFTVNTGASYAFARRGEGRRKPEALLVEEERRLAEKGKVEAKLDLSFDAAGEAAPTAPLSPGKPAAAVTGSLGASAGGGRNLRALRRAAPRSEADKSISDEERGSRDEGLEKAGESAKLAESLDAADFKRKDVFFGASPDLAGLGAAPAPLEPALRRNFADTALWRSDVRTGKDGIGEVKLKVPDNLTTWRAALVGGTRPSLGDTLVGDGEGRFRTRKNLLVRLQAPRFLTRADTAVISTPVHNYLPEAIDAQMELLGKEIDARSFSKTSIRVGAGDIASLDWEIAPRAALQGLLTARALTAKESDAIEESIPIVPFGRRHRGGEGGLLENEALVRFEMPEKVIDGTARLRLEISPRFDRELRSSISYLRAYPYGCVEQSVSGFLAAISLAEALDRLGTPDQELRNLLRDLIPKRIVKLLNAQRSSGGWGWWGPRDASLVEKAPEGSDPRMTAMALLGLEKARLAGFRVQEDRLEKARARSLQFLKRSADGSAGGLVAYALSLSGKAPAEDLNRLFRTRESSAPAGAALLALACERQGLRAQASEIGKLLASRAQDLLVNGKVAGKFIPARSARENRPDDVLATANALLLLDAAEPGSPLAPRLEEGLLAMRSGVHWGTTDATAAAVTALAGHAARTAKESAEAEIAVEVNGEVLKTIAISPARPRDESPTLEIPSGKLKAGENRVALHRKGSGRFGYAASWEFFTPADSMEEEGNLLKIHRDYVAYAPTPIAAGPAAAGKAPAPPEMNPSPAVSGDDPEAIGAGDPATRIAGPAAAWILSPEGPPPGNRILEAGKAPPVKARAIERAVSGDKVRVILTVEAREDLEYALIEDPIPAGCEVVDDPDRFEGSYDRRELRSQKVVFFRTRLPKGSHRISYLLRPTFPGSYRALPALAQCMYEPGILGLSSDRRLSILRREAREAEGPPEFSPDEKLYRLEQLLREFASARADGAAPVAIGSAAELRTGYRELLALPLAPAYGDLALARLTALDLAGGDPKAAVHSFEELRRRNPRLGTSEEDLARAAAAYGATKEYEGEIALQRTVFERRYRVDRAVADTFYGQGQHLRAQSRGLELLASYPDSARVIADAFELARRYADLKIQEPDPRTRKPRERTMLRESVEGMRVFLSHFPAIPQASEAQFLVITALEALGDADGAARESEAFIRRYPKSHLLDDALAKLLEASYRLGRYERVLEAAPRLADGEFLQADGKFGRSPHADLALHLVAKTRHARGEIEEAILAYGKIAERIPDAAEALAQLTARALSAPALSTIPLAAKPELAVDHRNVPALELRAYRVDLPVLFASGFDLSGAAAIDLTGIEAVKSWEEKLPPGRERRTTRLPLPVAEKGAYLVVGRAREDSGAKATGGRGVSVLEFSSLVLRSDLEIELHRAGDHLRVHVFRRGEKGERAPAAGARVRVASQGEPPSSGETDARGIFEARAFNASASVLVEKDGQYAVAGER